jgi:hypothetical protein
VRHQVVFGPSRQAVEMEAAQVRANSVSLRMEMMSIRIQILVTLNELAQFANTKEATVDPGH